MKVRESYLFGRVEMLAIEACVHYKMKNNQKAFSVLQEAYDTAAPNDLFMPFIELGKDMRTLTSAALKDAGDSKGAVDVIPAAWLEKINRKAASYAKHQGHVAAEYKRVNGLTYAAPLSARETEVLSDLSHGLTRSEMAVNRNLSINSVKMIINSIYSKLGADNLASLIRIAVERKLI
jgi:LuxR family maltose regulon positive regulatory protein